MKTPTKECLLRIFVGESDRWEQKPLFEAIVLQARELGLAGASVTRGLMGYGAHSQVHTSKILRLSEDLPVVIEIVDERDKVETLLPFVDRMISEGLVTMEKVEVIRYRPD